MENNLRPTPLLSAWAAINPLALPVLPEGPPPYEEISSNDYFDRPQSAIMVTCITSHMLSSDNVFSLIASEKYEFY